MVRLGLGPKLRDGLPAAFPPEQNLIYSGHVSSKFVKRNIWGPDYYEKMVTHLRKTSDKGIFIARNPFDSLISNFVYWQEYLRSKRHVGAVASNFNNDTKSLANYLNDNIDLFLDFVENGVSGDGGALFYSFEEFIDETVSISTCDVFHVLFFESFCENNSQAIKKLLELIDFESPDVTQYAPRARAGVFQELMQIDSPVSQLLSMLSKKYSSRIESSGLGDAQKGVVVLRSVDDLNATLRQRH